MQFFNIVSILAFAAGISATIEAQYDATFDGERFAISASCRPINGDIVYDCGSSSDLFQISKVTLSPPRPRKGQKLSVNLIGTVKDTIPEKSNAHVTAKLGIFTVVDKDYDFCKSIEDDKVKCPINKGPFNATKVVEIPSNIPSGNYLVNAVATTPNRKQIIHVQLKLSL